MAGFFSLAIVVCCVGQISAADRTKPTLLVKEKEIARHSLWEVVCSTPSGYVPQGLDACNGDLFLSGYARGSGSAVFQWKPSRASFRKLFSLPPDATHTSGIAFVPGRDDRLFAVDYDSDLIYLIDVEASRRTGQALVLAKVKSGLAGTSACCVAEIPGAGTRLLVTDFLNSSRNVCFEFDLLENTIRRDARHSYRNFGFSQGITVHRGCAYETGNRFLNLGYVVQYRLEDALKSGYVKPLKVWDGPNRMIEDIAFLNGDAYVTDEQTNRLYRARLSTGRLGSETPKQRE